MHANCVLSWKILMTIDKYLVKYGLFMWQKKFQTTNNDKNNKNYKYCYTNWTDGNIDLQCYT